MLPRARCSTDLNLEFNLPDLVFDAPVDGILAERTQIGILGQPVEVAVTKRQGFFQRGSGAGEFAVERVAARKVIKDQRVARFEAGKALIHFQTVFELAALSVVIAENLKRFNVLRIAADNSLEETDFHIKVARLFS